MCDLAFDKAVTPVRQRCDPGARRGRGRCGSRARTAGAMAPRALGMLAFSRNPEPGRPKLHRMSKGQTSVAHRQPPTARGSMADERQSRSAPRRSCAAGFVRRPVRGSTVHPKIDRHFLRKALLRSSTPLEGSIDADDAAREMASVGAPASTTRWSGQVARGVLHVGAVVGQEGQPFVFAAGQEAPALGTGAPASATRARRCLVARRIPNRWRYKKTIKNLPRAPLKCITW